MSLMIVSLVERKYRVGASQLFNWRNLECGGALTAVTAGESVVPASELAAARAQINQLQRMLGKKTMEAEILRYVRRNSRFHSFNPPLGRRLP